MDSSVSPGRVLSGQPDDQASYLGVDGRPPSRFVRWLCPVPADSSLVPAHHGVWFHDQKRVASTCPSHCRSEDGSVGVGELWSVDLALQDQDLVPEREDLSVACIT